MSTQGKCSLVVVPLLISRPHLASDNLFVSYCQAE